jgi:hypothetical protein
MKQKHTPGPWRWHGHYLMQDVPGIDNPYSTPAGYPIADDGSAGDEYSPTIDTDGPNARLIAAAPELLASLKTLVDAVEDHDNPVDQGLAAHHDSMQAARAAIAKAEGRDA